MRLTTAIPIILSVTVIILLSGCVQSAPVVVTVDSSSPAVINVKPGTQTIINVNPNPSYTPALRSYHIDKSHDIWHAQDSSSYITPNNEWVKYYASQLFVDEDGNIKYKNKPFWNNKFKNTYISDWVQFGNGARGSIANDDYWVNPDYYLANGMKGDCEDWMTTVTSLMLSGEMSIVQDGNFVKQVIPAKAVLGYAAGYPDGWVEYQAYNKTWITATASLERPIIGTEYSVTAFLDKSQYSGSFETIFEFTDKEFRMVK